MFPLRFGWQGPSILLLCRSHQRGFSLAVNSRPSLIYMKARSCPLLRAPAFIPSLSRPAGMGVTGRGFDSLTVIQKHIISNRLFSHNFYEILLNVQPYSPCFPFWVKPMDSCLRRNDKNMAPLYLQISVVCFLVTPLRGVTFCPALCATFNMADQSPALSLPVF